MTRDEALQEARRRWGAAGRVWIDGMVNGAHCPPEGYEWQSIPPKAVGIMVGRRKVKMGKAQPPNITWEAAFADADRRAAGEGELT